MSDALLIKSIKLSGRIDTARVGEIETGFYAQVGSVKKDGAALIDLKEVDFLSSLGIRLLVTAGKQFSQRQVRFGVIAPASSDVMEALEVSGLPSLFSFYASEDEARAAL